MTEKSTDPRAEIYEVNSKNTFFRFHISQLLFLMNGSITIRSMAVYYLLCHTLAGRPVDAALVALRANAHIRAICIHTLSSWKAEISFQTLINV